MPGQIDVQVVHGRRRHDHVRREVRRRATTTPFAASTRLDLTGSQRPVAASSVSTDAPFASIRGDAGKNRRTGLREGCARGPNSMGVDRSGGRQARFGGGGRPGSEEMVECVWRRRARLAARPSARAFDGRKPAPGPRRWRRRGSGRVVVALRGRHRRGRTVTMKDCETAFSTRAAVKVKSPRSGLGGGGRPDEEFAGVRRSAPRRAANNRDTPECRRRSETPPGNGTSRAAIAERGGRRGNAARRAGEAVAVNPASQRHDDPAPLPGAGWPPRAQTLTLGHRLPHGTFRPSCSRWRSSQDRAVFWMFRAAHRVVAVARTWHLVPPRQQHARGRQPFIAKELVQVRPF